VAGPLPEALLLAPAGTPTPPGEPLPLTPVDDPPEEPLPFTPTDGPPPEAPLPVAPADDPPLEEPPAVTPDDPLAVEAPPPPEGPLPVAPRESTCALSATACPLSRVNTFTATKLDHPQQDSRRLSERAHPDA
jgi:hypothetical protein